MILSFLIGQLWTISKLEERIKSVENNMNGMGSSWQQCFDGVTDVLNQHSDSIRQQADILNQYADALDKHQKAINFLTSDKNE